MTRGNEDSNPKEQEHPPLQEHKRQKLPWKNIADTIQMITATERQTQETQREMIPNPQTMTSMDTDEDRDKLTMYNLNVRSLHKRLDMELGEAQPDVATLTETKLNMDFKRKINLYTKCGLTNYEVWHSGHKNKYTAGVLIAVRKEMARYGAARQITGLDVPGHMIGIELTLPGSKPLTLIGIYSPTEDITTRDDIYDKLDEYLLNTNK
jgi:hypothetical protein